MGPDAINGSSLGESSNLSHIQVPSNDPMDLFKEWFEEAKSSGMSLPNRMCVSSSSRLVQKLKLCVCIFSSGEVTARSLLLRQLEEDGFVIMTDSRSLKCKQWEENPKAAFTFFWGYKKNGREVARQVRAEGTITELSQRDYSHLYDKEPLYCKIRAHLCHQGQQVEWEDVKSAHDNLLQNYRDGLTTLPMPDHVVFYKLNPKMIEYYGADDISIGDRVIFIREESASEWKGSWKHHHIYA